MNTANTLIREEQLRHPSLYSTSLANTVSTVLEPISKGPLFQTADNTDPMDVCRLLPALAELPEAMLKKLDLATIFQLNAALAKDKKSAAKLSVNARLNLNAKKLIESPTTIAAGVDNRRDLLHPARFLGGATCSASEMWLSARRILGDKGVPALGSYDLDSLGCGGCVTPKGWEALHNPSSQELKLKMFYMPNVANTGLSAKKVALADGDEALSIGDSLREIADMEGYRAALNTAREALHSVMPWNRSISAIVGFMTNSNYLSEDLKSNNRRVAILSEFTDYVFGRNALNWENGHPFLSADDLAHVWMQWKGKRSALFTKYSEKPWQRTNSKKSDICRRFNVGHCPKQADKECKSHFGLTLRHVCNKFLGGGKMCEKDHPRSDHK